MLIRYKIALMDSWFVYEIPRELLNGFAPNSQGKHLWSLTWTILKVKVKGQGHHRVFGRYPHWQCIVTRSLQITSCSSRRDHSVAAEGDGSAQHGRTVIYNCLICVWHISGTALLTLQQPVCSLCLVNIFSSSFCLCVKYLGNCWTDLHQIHTADMFGPSLRGVWRSRSKVKVTRDKNVIFRPFWQPVCGLRLAKHL